MCVYSEEEGDRKEAMSLEVHAERQLKRGRARNTLGSLATIPGMFGLMLAQCAIDFLCGQDAFNASVSSKECRKKKGAKRKHVVSEEKRV